VKRLGNRRLQVLALAGAALAGTALAGPPLPEAAAVPHVLLSDTGSGQALYARSADKAFLPASVTKAMTAWVVFGLLDKGQLRRDSVITVSEATARTWSGKGTTLWLKPGENVPVDTLLRGVTVVSANDAAVVLAEGVAGDLPTFLRLMNAEARRLGMTGSRFASPNGLPDGGATVVTARDLVLLGAALERRHPALYRDYFGQPSFTWKGTVHRNRDPLLGIVAGADGIKTGHTDEAGYNFLGSAVRSGRRLMLVIGGAATEAERAAASRALVEWGFAGWTSRPLFAAGAAVATARVQNGDARSVGLVADRAIYAALPAGSQPQVRLRVVYRGPVVAPIAKGAPVAELEIGVAGLPVSRVPLRAAAAVAAAGPLDRLVNGLAALVS
jgi:serine-type D-Ala-D-Ala carboxypeptidase (penicillin-binding protein 5/6)